MKKYFLTLTILMLLFSSVKAQVLKIEQSEPLGVPKYKTATKLVFLENGNTAFLHFKDKEIELKIFDTKRKLILSKVTRLTLSNTASVDKVFAIKNDIIIFNPANKGTMLTKFTLLLNRIIINGITGVLVKEEQIGQLSSFGYGKAVGAAWEHREPSGFYISKDENTNNYAVASFDSFEKDKNKRLKITHYGFDHKIISNSYFQLPNDEFNFIRLCGILVQGDSKVLVAAEAYNIGDKKESSLCFGILDKGVSFFHQKILKTITDRSFEKVDIQLENNSRNLVLFCSITPWYNASLHSSFILQIDPTSLTTVYEKAIDPPTLSKNFKSSMHKPEPFSGIPLDYFYNEDGTFSILYREVTIFSRDNSSVTYDRLGSIAIQLLNNKFQETKAWLVPHDAMLSGGYSYKRLLQPKFSSETPALLYEDDESKGCYYFSNNGNKGVLLNVFEPNLKALKEGTLGTISRMDKTNCYFVSLTSNPESTDPIFEKFSTTDTGFLRLSDVVYEAKTQTYAAIRKHKGKRFEDQIVWFKL